jgi:subtilase family serine protease
MAIRRMHADDLHKNSLTPFEERTMATWTRTLFGRFGKSPAKGRRSSRSTRFSLESLDDRCLLSTITPAQMTAAYGLNVLDGKSTSNGTGQTIAIIDWGYNPYVAGDLQTFDTDKNLAAANLTVVERPPIQGDQPLSSSTQQDAWTEEALDVEWAHVIAPGASLLLIETYTSSNPDIIDALNYARNQSNVSVVSMSFGQPESLSLTAFDSDFTTPANHIGMTFVAATGDDGSTDGGTSNVINWPASSPNVVAVGGTTLELNSNGSYLGETGWSVGSDSWNLSYGTGGGVSKYETEPSYQKIVQQTGYRTTPDVSMDADPATGVFIVYHSLSGQQTTTTEGGTSLAAPMFAGLISIADEIRVENHLGTLDGRSQTLPLLYTDPSAFHDITVGNNGGYSAKPGYDEVTGLGSPKAALPVAQLVFGQSSRAVGVDASGDIFSLGLGNNTLTEWTGGVSKTISTTIQSIGVDKTGTLYALNSSTHSVAYWNGTSLIAVSGTDIQSIGVDGSGTLYLLNQADVLWTYSQTAGWYEIGTGIRQIAVDGTSTLFALNQSDVLWTFTQGVGWSEIGVGLQSIDVDQAGTLYALNQSDVLWVYSLASGWTEVGVGIQSIAVNNTGFLYALNQSDVLWSFTLGVGWSEIGVGLQSIAVDSTGVLYTLNQADVLWSYSKGSGWTEIGLGIQSIAVDKTGTLYTLNQSDVLLTYSEGSGWTEIGLGIQSIAVDKTGTLYTLNQADVLWTYTLGVGWVSIRSNVQSIKVDVTGSLYALVNGAWIELS